ncbi:uncharacterized protein LOC112495187 [Cephus cinctus]|uniref:Uncharacterized protein LOC112495187 n=1 Tax=Cephus cinctus TaxID=211228 RepID=A0AAJ7RSR8_CEPCN|nr:uncharacterized protein LOC112495187 [Cephus cinctus]
MPSYSFSEYRNALQNYLGSRYRLVHSKIKDIQTIDLGSKIPENFNALSNLRVLVSDKISRVPTLSRENFTKFQRVVTARITKFPYGHHMRHSWIFRCCLIGTVISYPIFLKMNDLVIPNGESGNHEVSGTKKEKLKKS